MTQQLPENIVNLLVSNTEPMVNNFNKIVSWLIKGTESEHKLPPAVASFLEDYAGVKQQADENAKALATALEIVEQLNKTLAEQAEQNAALKGHVADLITKVNAIEVAESKPKTRKKAEPKAETVAELISRAVNAPDRKYVIRFMGVPPIHFDEFSIKAKLHKRKGTATYTVSSV